MVYQDQLSAMLSDFARTLLTDFSIQDILDHLVERIVDALPVTAAGVTLISPGTAPHYIAASAEAALAAERLQTEFGQGPCRLAYEAGEAVVVPPRRIGWVERGCAFPHALKPRQIGGGPVHYSDLRASRSARHCHRRSHDEHERVTTIVVTQPPQLGDRSSRLRRVQ